MVRILSFVFIAPFIYMISILPFWVLYLMSDIWYFIGYRLLGYRVSLVKKNIKTTFPAKHEDEINAIIRRFYKNFFDLFFETVKVLTISKNQLHNRVTLGNMQALEHNRDMEQSVIISMGHFGNWEMGAARFELADYPRLKAVYKPLSNDFFDALMTRIRTRFGGDVYAMEETLDRMREDRGKLTAVALLADQNPSSHNAYWYQFLGRKTPVFTGVELLARRFNYPVIYLRVDRVKRGYYQLNCEVLSNKPAETGKYEITHEYIRRVERDIYSRPEEWLWTHNRWKRKPEDQLLE